ncbi:rhodanese-like domain-containing protein [Sporosarcina sp. FSL K6-1508]|uniref:rhodanese-like domain-containing protein n=1 Tax=Sporosarcina sp. FSL K6-1508 TaxID=2921553 RepID=UPI0030F65FA7
MIEITPIEVQEMLNTNKTIHLIDVREVDEVKEGKIPGAIHIPLGLLEFRMHELDKGIAYTMVCRSGGRSGRAVQLLEGHGFKVVNMVGGMNDWEGQLE